ncbi:MAG: type IV secretion system DNA-binding domain-containing protein [Rhodospirillaceae bacterium]
MKVDGYQLDISPAVLAGVAAAPAAAAATFLGEFALSPAQGWDGRQVVHLPWEMAARSFLDAVPVVGTGWTSWHDLYVQNGLLGEVLWRIHGMEAAAVAGFLVGMILVLPRCGWKLMHGERQIGGRRLALPPTGKKVAARALAPEVKRTGSRSLLAPGVPLPYEHEVKGIFFCGAPGSGKTAAMKWLLSQWIDKGYRLVVLDAGKGDFISEWPSENFYLLAPHDNRIQPGLDLAKQAKAWDIAADCTSVQDAGELAERVIAESNEPQWSAGARLILQGCIVGLQKTKGYKWGWRDLHEVVTKPDAELNAWMKAYFPDAMRYTAIDASGNANKNAASYLTNCCATVVKFTRPLSLAWGDTPRAQRPPHVIGLQIPS